MIKKVLYKTFVIGLLSASTVGAIGAGATMMSIAGNRKSIIKEGYNDNDKFLEFCLKNDDLNKMYNEQVYPMQVQYEKGNISYNELQDIANSFIEQAKMSYTFNNYLDATNQSVEYNNADNLVTSGLALMATGVGIGAMCIGSLGASKREEFEFNKEYEMELEDELELEEYLETDSEMAYLEKFGELYIGD